MNLFTQGLFTSHSGLALDGKIECDVLTEEDLDCIAGWIGRKIEFGAVFGVPAGGTRLSEKLRPYCKDGSEVVLIVDDVLTTGASMERLKRTFPRTTQVQGVVIFSRGECPDWVYPLFQSNPLFGVTV